MALLPNAQSVRVEDRKVRDYLLNLYHPWGATKAQFFYSQGFERAAWTVLQRSLMVHGATNPTVGSLRKHGKDYWKVLGPLETPSGKRPLVFSVWEVEDEGMPRLISSYPR